MVLGLIIAEFELFVIFSPDLEAPVSRFPPLLFYFLYLVFHAFPGERLWSFSVALPGIAFDFKIVQATSFKGGGWEKIVLLRRPLPGFSSHTNPPS
jgi:hypothetical protein